MTIIQQTSASFGPRRWIEPLERPYSSAAAIARWRYLNGRLRISTADAIRVCLSLSTGQQVRHAERDRALTKNVLAGDVVVVRPGVPSETAFQGDAEVVQVFIDPASLGHAASNALMQPLVALPGEALKRAVIQLFVAARHDDGRTCRLAEFRLRQEVGNLLAAPVNEERGYARGG